MAAPSIPNLSSLRFGRGGGRHRGRGRGAPPGSPENGHAANDSRLDRIVQQTDNDASVSRMSATVLGYLDDPFARHLSPPETQRRLPIINRGTYVRTLSIDKLVLSFLEHNRSRKCQIISLGAGSDTRFFRFMSSTPRLHDTLVYHEIDFAENTIPKVTAILKGPEKLKECIISNPPGADDYCSAFASSDAGQEDTLDSPRYCIHPLDLRTLDFSQEMPKSFARIDRHLPTLLISECCLVYLKPNAADAAVQYFTQHFFAEDAPLRLILYEPIRPDDAFGKVMVSNLAARGIVLQTLQKYGSLEAQAARMRMYGFERSRGLDVHQLWDRGVDETEKERVAGLEMVDELEEWELLAKHYCVVWAWRENAEYRTWEQWEHVFPDQ